MYIDIEDIDKNNVRIYITKEIHMVVLKGIAGEIFFKSGMKICTGRNDALRVREERDGIDGKENREV